MTIRCDRRIVAVLSFGLVVVGCGVSDEQAGGSTSTTREPTTVTTAGPVTTNPAGSSAPSTTADSASSSSLRDMRETLEVASIELLPADEGGPHPTLGWNPVDGAASYWLILRDSSGQVYWAWTGVDTAVRVGGGDKPELNQTAALHEPMTWTVAALDNSGNLIAFSNSAVVSP